MRTSTLTPSKCASGLSPYDRPANFICARLVVEEDLKDRAVTTYASGIV
jgi:hypothetical protein